MSYVGLVPSEHTTGQQRRLGAITKTGSGHARRLLVEAAWHYRAAATHRQGAHRPPSRPARRSDRDRLERPTTPAPHLEPTRSQRAKRRTIIAVAAARELAGFCWAITRIE